MKKGNTNNREGTK